MIFLRILSLPFLMFFTSFVIFYLDYRLFKRYKPIKSEFKKVKFKPRYWFYRLFVEFPRRYALDYINRNPDEFPECEQGLYIFEGPQGSGKTLAMTYLLNQKQKQYQALKVYTNYGYLNQTEEFTDWKKQFDYDVGLTGAIYAIDEIHIWLCSSLQSKDFPPELLTQVCQNRKNHRAVYGTVQVFGRCPKPIREQTKLLFTPVTIFGCLTFVVIRKPILDENATLKSFKFRGLFFFVHDDEIRSMYRTHDIIKKLDLVKDNSNIFLAAKSSSDSEQEEQKEKKEEQKEQITLVRKKKKRLIKQ